MGIKEIEDKKEDWPGSSHCEQAPGYQWAILDICEQGHVIILLMNWHESAMKAKHSQIYL